MANSENTEEEPKKPIVLIVDDSPANVQILALMFRNLYQVKIATSGAKCIEIANTTPKPNLILLDIMMPKMSGYEVCQKLRQDWPVNDLPVINHSASQ